MKLTSSQLRKLIREALDEAIEGSDLFWEDEVKPLFAPHAPKGSKERAAFFSDVRRAIGTRRLEDIKDDIMLIVTRAKRMK